MSVPPPTVIGPYTQGEIPPPIVVTFKDSAGAAISLTGYTAKWIYRRHAIGAGIPFGSGDPVAVQNSATVASDQIANKGQVTYIWVSADLGTAGEYDAEMWVGNLTNRFASVRYVYSVRDAIAVPTI